MDFTVKKELQEYYEDVWKKESKEWISVGAKGKYRNIVALTEGLQFEKVVEVGAGNGSILELLEKNNFAPSLYALDISSTAIEAIKEKNFKTLVEALQFDGYKIPYPDDFFDLVILSNVLEHVEFPRALLREMKRVAKLQFIEVPRDLKHNVDKYADYYFAYGHINVYNPSVMRFLLKSEGFEILKEQKGFSDRASLQFNKSKLGKLKINLFIIVRNIAYRLLPEWRADRMTNYFAVLTK